MEIKSILHSFTYNSVLQTGMRSLGDLVRRPELGDGCVKRRFVEWPAVFPASRLHQRRQKRLGNVQT